MKIKLDHYQVQAGEKVNLDKRPTITAPLYATEEEYRNLLHGGVERLSRLQQLLYASAEKALLLILQGMDSAGKDSAIRHVMSGVNPQGCSVHSFKQPSAEELAHDFLWRCQMRLPERGRIGIFNRSYYEEVLVVRVHPGLLDKGGFSPDRARHNSFWKGRFRSINQFEAHLDRNNTHVVKIFLHLSKEEQRRRFLARIDEARKNWKFSLADIAERKLWKRYAKAYETCLAATSTAAAPWFVVPADDKRNARLIVAEIVGDTLEKLDLHYPQLDVDRQAELAAIRKQLEKVKSDDKR
jgi:PPK2 family polyphosphate:nucleotide phosphotransferase